MTTPAFTPGPLNLKINEKWPFDMDTIDANGKCVFATPMPCHSTLDKSFEEALNCLNFKDSQEREQGKVANHRALADEYLRAAAPDLFYALQTLIGPIEGMQANLDAAKAARAALKKATGETK